MKDDNEQLNECLEKIGQLSEEMRSASKSLHEDAGQLDGQLENTFAAIETLAEALGIPKHELRRSTFRVIKPRDEC